MNLSEPSILLPVLQIASSNPGKVREFRLGVRLWQEETGQRGAWGVESVPGIAELPPCVEDAETFAGNAEKKALHYSRCGKGFVLADDSGLEVDALRGAPGVYSARFAGPKATDAENNAKLLRLLREAPAADRTGRFVCELALAREGQLLGRFRGVAEGLILDSPRGANGFGYDPLFFDTETGRTFAELSAEEKIARSHRGKALRALLAWLSRQPTLLSP